MRNIAKTMNGQSFLKDPQTNWRYILIITILASIVGGWTLVYSQKIEKEVASIKFIEIELPEKIDKTADWKIYKNEEYGFGFKYPSNFQLGVIDPEPFEYGMIRYNYPHKNLFPIVNLDLKTDKYEGTGFKSAYFTVGADLNKENLSDCLLETSKAMADLRVLKIDNKTFHRTTLFDDAMGGVRGKVYIYEVLDNSRCFVLHGFLGYRDSRGFVEKDAVWLDEDSIKEILYSFDQIVSTFRFLE